MTLLLLASLAQLGLQERVEQEVVLHIAQRLELPADDVEILNLGIRNFPSCEDSQIFVDSSPSQRFRGHGDVRISFEQGSETCSTMMTRVKLNAWVETPISAHETYPGEELLLEKGRVPLIQLQGRPVPGLLDPSGDPWIAKTTIRARAPVSAHQVAQRPASERGELVKLVIAGENISIVAQGELKEDASVGDTVRVLCSATGAQVEGKLIRPGCVGVLPITPMILEKCGQ